MFSFLLIFFQVFLILICLIYLCLIDNQQYLLINLSSRYINKSEIYEYLNTLDNHSSTGLDGVLASFFKACGSVLMHHLYLMFNNSLSTGFIPSIWKMFFVIPVHKSGKRHNVTNYWPISKLSIIPKMFEAIITKKLTLIISPCICSNQHGFRPNRYSIIMFKLTYLHWFPKSIQ